MKLDGIPGVAELLDISNRLHIASNLLRSIGMAAQADAVRDLGFIIMTILRDIGIAASMRKAVTS